MPILAPFEAFARDAAVLNVEEDETRLPIRWLAAAQVATRLADARPHERKSLLRVWIRQQTEDGADGVWSALAVPGVPVRDLATASAALCTIAADMERGGALNLAYSTVTHMRIAMMGRGPVGARAGATLQQARVLRQMGLLEEASDTYEAAMEDAVRAGDKELEGRALLGLGVVAGQRGNYPEVFAIGRRALALLPDSSSYVVSAHNDLMVAAIVTRDFPAAFNHGWHGFDRASDTEQRAQMMSNLACLALRTGRLTAARRGFLAMLGLTNADRLRIPALAGLALASAASLDTAELKKVSTLIERASRSSALPYEIASANFELAQAWQQTGDIKKAEECLARGRELAVAHGFHEVVFRSELLAEALQSARTEVSARHRDDRIEQAIDRFSELVVDDRVLAAV